MAPMDSYRPEAPRQCPVAAADGPGAEADGGEVEIGVAEGAERKRSRMSYLKSR